MSASKSPMEIATKNKEPAGVSARTKALASAGVVAAGALAVLLNVVAARHYKRWDATRNKLYTLAAPTLATLDEMERDGHDVEIFVFIGGGDPLLGSVKAMLENYQARAPKRLHIRYLDPDRDRAEFVRVQTELDVKVGNVEGGRVMADAQLVVRSGKRIWYVKTDDMVVLDEGDDAKVRPRVETAITSSIRSVLTTDRLKICFTTGHHEAGLDDPEKEGLSTLKNTLAKDNFDPVSIDTTKPNVTFAGCALIAVMGPNDPFKRDEETPIIDAVTKGTPLLLVVPPEIDLESKNLRPLRLNDVAALAGVTLDDAVVVEQQAELREPNGLGLVLRARVHPHATTDDFRKFVEARGSEALVPLAYVRPMSRTTSPGIAPQEMLVSSDHSFAMRDVPGFLASKDEPKHRDDERMGPLDLAVATERDKSIGGAKIVVVGASTPFINATYFDGSPPSVIDRLLGQTWLSWLTARPAILDLPPKPSVQVAMHMTEDDLSAIARYVLFYMPIAAGLIGAAVWMRRRTTEGKRYRQPRPPASASDGKAS